MKNALDIISKLLCLCLSVILFIVIFVYLGLGLFSKIVVKENVKVLFNEIRTEEIMDSDSGSLLMDLYQLADENNIDRNVINGLLNSRYLKEIISNYYSEMVELILYDKEANEITISDINSAINRTLNYSENDLGYKLTESQKEIIIEYTENNSRKIINLFPTSEKVINDLGINSVENIRILLGNTTKIFLIVVISIIVIIIALLRWSIYKFAIWSGAATVIAGLILMMLGTIFSEFILNTDPQMLSTSFKNLVQNNILGVIHNTVTVTLTVGSIQIAYYFVIRNIFNNAKY